MKQSNFLLKLLIVGLSLLFISTVKAECTRAGLSGTSFRFGDITVPYLLPVGGTIATRTETVNLYIAGATIPVLECDGGGTVYYYMTYSSIATGLPHVYQTTVPGVGIMIQDITNNKYLELSGTAVPLAQNHSTLVTFTATLVKTGNIVSGTLAENWSAGEAYASLNKRYLALGIYESNINQEESCTVTTPSVNVPMAAIFPANLSGINTTAGDTPFTVGLSCYAGAQIRGSLSFTQNTDTANTSVIALTGTGSAGVAKGVGIQLLYNGTPLSRNTEIALKTSAGGVEFPAGAFTSRYFQTQSTVLPGSANATATLNLKFN